MKWDSIAKEIPRFCNSKFLPFAKNKDNPRQQPKRYQVIKSP